MACAAPQNPGAHKPWSYVRKLSPRLADRLALYVGKLSSEYREDPQISGVVRKILSGKAYDVIVGRQLRVTAKTGLLGIRTLVLDVDDLDTEYYESQLSLRTTSFWKRKLLCRASEQLKAITPSLYGQCEKLWISSEHNRIFPGLENARLLPNIPFPDYESSDIPDVSTDEKILMTVAAFSHRPNVEGVDLFLRQVWPDIHRSLPDAVYHIVGTGIDRRLQRRWGDVPGVRLVGYVEKLSREYRKASLSVVPLQWGAGTNIKVLESLAFERACVVTPFAHRGYEDCLRDGESLCRAKDAREFVQACVMLLTNPERCARMGKRGASVVRDAFSYDRFRRIVEETMTDLMSFSAHP